MRRWKAFLRQFFCWEKTRNRHSPPEAADLAFREPFRSIIFRDSEEKAEFSLDDIDQACEEWTEARNNVIISMLPEDCSSKIAITSGSQFPFLATLMFRISGYPSGDTRVCSTIEQMCKSRRCLYPQAALEDFASSEEFEFWEMIVRNSMYSFPSIWGIEPDRPWLWDHKRFEFCHEAHELAKDLLALLGLDPYTTTVSEMKEREESFKCTSCRTYSISWDEAVSTKLFCNDFDRNI